MTAVESASELRAWILGRIHERGPIPFEEFMDAALYHPEHGYYCRLGAVIGTRGDFYTSSDVHPAFGRLLARQIAEMIDRTVDESKPFRIIEMGPGQGRLACDIAEGLFSERPDLAMRATYTLVEISPAHRETQRNLLRDAGAGERLGGVEWTSWRELLREAGAEGLNCCVVANEFIDALPVHRIHCTRDEIREIHVGSAGDSDDAGFVEVLGDPCDPDVSAHMARLAAEWGIRLEDGQRAEVGLRGLEWVGSFRQLLGSGGKGGAVIIDYGYPARELYSPRRRDGTLICYYNHRTADDPLAHVGEQDMTAHVDFSSVEKRAREAGLDVSPLVSQMRFLVAQGLADLLAGKAGRNDAEGLRERLALRSLMAPDGMGEVFKVMMMTRGTEAAALTGARDPFRT